MNVLVIEIGWFEIAACDIQTRCSELLNMGGKSPVGHLSPEVSNWTFPPMFSNSLHLVCRSQTAVPNQPVSGMRRHCATPNQYLHSSEGSTQRENVNKGEVGTWDADSSEDGVPT